VNSDCEAIEWCIQEGNSTKLADDKDEFEQTLPSDNIGGSPYGDGVPTKPPAPVNHQGLGLFKLVSLVKDYGGELFLASGSCLMKMDKTGCTSYSEINYWHGVAISCTFSEKRLQEETNNKDKNPEIVDIMGLLRG
jgi:hypothetical protein